jgi:hypothetical protein
MEKGFSSGDLKIRIRQTTGTLHVRLPTLQYIKLCAVISVADPDPGSGAILTPGSGIRDG